MMYWIYAAIYFAGIASALWSVIGVFNTKITKDNLIFNILRVTTGAFWIFSIYQLWVQEGNRPNDGVLLLASVIALFGVVLFWITRDTIKKHDFSVVFSQDIPMSLVTSGPYKYVRNPFYLSYLATYLSAVIVTSNVIAAILYIVIVGLYIDAARREEMKFEKSAVSAQFMAYKANVGRFLPKLKFTSWRKV